MSDTMRFPCNIIQSGLFTKRKFLSHRIFGLIFLIQYSVSTYLFFNHYVYWLSSPFVYTVPLNSLIQSINAAYTFTFLPKKEDPGFAAVSDKAVLSYYTVVENSFYASQLLFACCYLHEKYFKIIRKTIVLEALYVFFIFYIRHLWPTSRINAALTNSKNKTDANRKTLILSSYAIKFFYLFAKHFIGTFPLYLQFLGRVDKDMQYNLYGIQILSSYAATISIFIHTLKFKKWIGPITAMVAYDIIIPGYAILFYRMRYILYDNSDVSAICFIAMILNLAPKIQLTKEHTIRPWFIWQIYVAYLFYSDYPTNRIFSNINTPQFYFVLISIGLHWFRF